MNPKKDWVVKGSQGQLGRDGCVPGPGGDGKVKA